MKTFALVVAVLAAACGGKKPESTTKPVETKSEMKSEMAEMHMSPELTKFHDVLAPHWHAEKGDKRMKDTCGAIADFTANADSLGKAPAPAGGDAAQWTAETKELSDAVAALGTTCTANDAAGFESAFERVHKGFHHLLENGEHGEHAEHAEHKM